MDERFSKLYTLPENLYATGSPVIIAAGVLLKDNLSGGVLAQLKLRNIQDAEIKAATVKITPLDIMNEPVGEAFEYRYLDLAAKRDKNFGQRKAVLFKEASARAFKVIVSSVIFSDNSVWTAADEEWTPFPALTEPERAFHDKELANQYRLRYGDSCTCIFQKERDLWRCVCGCLNRCSESSCHSCHREMAELEVLDMTQLCADRDLRLKAKKKERKINTIAIAVGAIVIIVAAILLSAYASRLQAQADTASSDGGKYSIALARAQSQSKIGSDLKEEILTAAEDGISYLQAGSDMAATETSAYYDEYYTDYEFAVLIAPIYQDYQVYAQLAVDKFNEAISLCGNYSDAQELKGALIQIVEDCSPVLSYQIKSGNIDNIIEFTECVIDSLANFSDLTDAMQAFKTAY